MAEPAADGDLGRLGVATVARRPVLVLGSASPARATLLRAAGITPIIWHSRVDEDALIAARRRR